MRFKNGSIIKSLNPGQSLKKITDETANDQYTGMYVVKVSKQGRSEENRPASADTKHKGNLDQKARSYEGTDKPSIPTEYLKWIHLFKEEKGLKALPQHQPWDHKIPLEEGKKPTVGPIYRLSQKELDALSTYLKENLAKGFIRPSSSSAAYPILFVPKKNGKLRLCVDYRKLNVITIKNQYPLLNADELRDRLAGAMFFTKLDIRGAYNLIRIAPGEEWKTAFRTRYGLYEYLVMPFGLTNAPASCQELVNNVLRNMLNLSVIAYLDDILIFLKTMKQHIIDVQNTLTCLAKVNLLLEPEKCEFHRTQVQFLGYIITREGVKADPEKV